MVHWPYFLFEISLSQEQQKTGRGGDKSEEKETSSGSIHVACMWNIAASVLLKG